jgi:hypothetical protein
MHTLDFSALFLVPVGLAVAFLAWVFVGLGKDYNRR